MLVIPFTLLLAVPLWNALFYHRRPFLKQKALYRQTKRHLSVIHPYQLTAVSLIQIHPNKSRLFSFPIEVKTSKPETAKARRRKESGSWNSALESITINDDSWWCQVTMVVESLANQEKYISLLNTACEEGERTSIYCLSYRKLLANVETLSQDRLDQCPAAQGVCHYASNVLSHFGILPNALVAQVTKYLIYLVKLNRIARIQAQALQSYESLVCRRSDSAQVNNDSDTKSDQHNEEWQEQCTVECTVNDAPFDGPNLYVILTGFRESDLPLELITAGIPLTSILRIEASRNESFHETVRRGTEKRPVRTSSVANLTKFWSVVEQQRQNAIEPFASIAVLTISIPELKVHEDDINTGQLKRTLYDKVAFTLYEVFEVHRAHGAYSNSMILETRITDEKKMESDLELYRKLLDAVPEEYVTVPLVLHAMLVQVEANAQIKLEDSKQGNLAKPGSDVLDQHSQTELSSDVRQRLEKLNAVHQLTGGINSDDDTTDDSHSDVVLHGDVLHMINWYLNVNEPLISKSTETSQTLLKILQDKRVTKIWDNYKRSPSKVKEYSMNLTKLRSFFKEDLNSEELQHYLHLLTFDKLIFNGLPPTSQTARDNETDFEPSSTELSLPRRSKSDTMLTLKTERALQRSKSDSLVDHRKSVSAFANCSALLELTDPRELLVPGYMHEHILSKRRSCWPPLQEFDFTELLSSQVLAQHIYDCLVNYDYFETVHFEPTDSVLCRCWNESPPGKISFEETVSKLKTPMCFREFCDHVIDAGEWMGCGPETCWLRRRKPERQARTSSISVARSEHNKSSLGETASRGSKKARKKGKKERRLNGSGKQKGEEITSERASLKKEIESRNIVGTVSSTSRAAVEERPYAVIGYDLGSLRVQVSNRKTNFLAADGTRVRVEVEDWLHQATDLRIALTIRATSLRLARRIPHSQSVDPFHLTTSTGIILSFRPVPKIGDNWYPSSVDFRASWPSGLMVKLVAGDTREDPFYVQQSLPVKNRRCLESHVNWEVCRKFLRNGTVLKYLADGTISVLRPNGDIVTCMEFRRRKQDGTLRTANRTTDQSDGTTRESKVSVEQKKNETSPIDYRVSGALQIPVDVSSVTEVPGRLEVSRYTVVNHEGRRYEVVDERLVSERHRLLVRTDTDYEVNEKFTRRDDGTTMLLNSNGELIVTFPDGTRITTAYIIEESPVTCEWTEEEHEWYFTSNWREGWSPVDGSVSSPESKFGEEAGRKSRSGRSSKMTTEIPIADGFLSILLTCRVEHKNYATVCYDQSTVNCTLSMPADLRVSISARGHYEVSTGHVNLKILEEGLTLWSKRHDTCGGWSTSSYYFTGTDTGRMSRTLFSITDALENTFQVDVNGSTHFRDGNQPTFAQASESSGDVGLCQCNLVRGTLDPRGKESETEPYGDADQYKFSYKEEAKWWCEECRSDTRLFAVNRDLTGCEYIRRSRVEELEMTSNNKTSTILYSIQRRPELRRLITLEPVEVEWRSKPKSPQHCFLAKRLQQTNFGRRELLRSTYSIPYDWLFPFGKNGYGISQNGHDMSLATGTGRRMPSKLLRIRILYGIKEPAGNPLIELQHALTGYWLSLLGSPAQNSSLRLGVEEATPPGGEEVTPAEFKKLEDDSRDLAFAVKTSIDGTLYAKGLQAPRKIQVEKLARKSPEDAMQLEQKDSDGEEFGWYRDCLRHKFILPYFESIPGACFLWIEEVISNVLSSSVPSSAQLFSSSAEEAEAH